MTCSTPVRRRPAPTGAGAAVPSGGATRRTTRWRRALLEGDAVPLQLTRFALTGSVATAVQVLIFLLLAPSGVLLANLVSWAGSTALSNELHRRRTFHADARIGWRTAQWEGSGLAALGLGLTTGALAVLALLVPEAGAPVQALLVLTVNATVGLGRFLALRWAFGVGPRTA